MRRRQYPAAARHDALGYAAHPRDQECARARLRGQSTQPVPYLPILARPTGQMMSSAAEMARFMRMMLNRVELDGIRIVGADSITRMETPTESVGARLKIGFGISTWVDPSRRIVTYGPG